MKKLIFVSVTGLFLFVVSFGVWAQGGRQGGQQSGQGGQASGTEATGQGNQVQNQNVVQTQNQGLESQLQVATQQVEQLMSMEKLGEEVGEQVKQMAKEQKTAQESMNEELAKLNARKGILKALFGPDHAAVQNLQKEISRNQMRINILEKIQAQIKNQADQDQLKVATQALVQQNTALQEKVQAEEQTKSLFGWMIRMFQN